MLNKTFIDILDNFERALGAFARAQYDNDIENMQAATVTMSHLSLQWEGLRNRAQVDRIITTDSKEDRAHSRELNFHCAMVNSISHHLTNSISGCLGDIRGLARKQAERRDE